MAYHWRGELPYKSINRSNNKPALQTDAYIYIYIYIHTHTHTHTQSGPKNVYTFDMKNE